MRALRILEIVDFLNFLKSHDSFAAKYPRFTLDRSRDGSPGLGFRGLAAQPFCRTRSRAANDRIDCFPRPRVFRNKLSERWFSSAIHRLVRLWKVPSRK